MPAEMDLKRAATEDAMPRPQPKKRRPPPRRTNPTSGQRGAFGNLDRATIPTDADLDCEDDTEALDYLRTVRQEASAIPHVLVAKKSGPQLPPVELEDGDERMDRSIYKDGRGDFRGYYQDGTYIARPDDWYDDDENEDEDEDEGEQENGEGETKEALSDYFRQGQLDEDGSDLQSGDSSWTGPYNSSSDEIHEAYYMVLREKYQSLRRFMHATPPKSVVEALSAETHPTWVGPFDRKSETFTKWTKLLRNTDPVPAQIASLHKDGVIRLLRIILKAKFFRRTQEVRERTSRWIWALLARLPEPNELDYQEVGYVRELGKRAVMFMLSMAEAEALREQAYIAGSDESQDDADEYEYADEEPYEDYFNDEDEEDFDDTAEDSHAAADVSVNGRNTLEEPCQNADPGKAANGEVSEEHKDVACVKANKLTPEVPRSPPGDTEMIKSEQSGGQIDASGEMSDIEMPDDSDMEDGEVSDGPTPEKKQPEKKQQPTELEALKAQLLAQLEGEDEGEMNQDPSVEDVPASVPSPAPDHASEAESANSEIDRAQANVRATLNMILTVAGEFYGQRDLLEFRDPFGGTAE